MASSQPFGCSPGTAGLPYETCSPPFSETQPVLTAACRSDPKQPINLRSLAITRSGKSFHVVVRYEGSSITNTPHQADEMTRALQLACREDPLLSVPATFFLAHLVDRTRVAWQKVKLLSRRFIPDVHRLVRRPRRNHLPVWCPCALEQILFSPVL